MITVEAKKVGARVIATVKVGIGTGQYTYTVQFVDQGSVAANEAEAQRELRKTLEEVLGLARQGPPNQFSFARLLTDIFLNSASS